GEIEAALARCEGVTQAIVLVRAPAGQPNAQMLVGYYVSAAPLDQTAIAKRLSKELPQYMVPSALVALPAMPLTPNGKPDRRALPEPQWSTTDNYAPPRDAREERLRDLFADSLGAERHTLGIRDDLFTVGLDSIIAIQLVSKIRQRLGSDFTTPVTVKDLFANK